MCNNTHATMVTKEPTSSLFLRQIQPACIYNTWSLKQTHIFYTAILSYIHRTSHTHMCSTSAQSHTHTHTHISYTDILSYTHTTSHTHMCSTSAQSHTHTHTHTHTHSRMAT